MSKDNHTTFNEHDLNDNTPEWITRPLTFAVINDEGEIIHELIQAQFTPIAGDYILTTKLTFGEGQKVAEIRLTLQKTETARGL
jgi:hypothetical protein